MGVAAEESGRPAAGSTRHVTPHMRQEVEITSNQVRPFIFKAPPPFMKPSGMMNDRSSQSEKAGHPEMSGHVIRACQRGRTVDLKKDGRRSSTFKTKLIQKQQNGVARPADPQEETSRDWDAPGTQDSVSGTPLFSSSTRALDGGERGPPRPRPLDRRTLQRHSQCFCAGTD